MIYVEKSQPAPESLAAEKAKKRGSYLCRDVLERLEADFKGKCYLCESKELTSINVEHLVPHRGDQDLKFDWNNMLFSCSHCNNTKLDKYLNLLNCTVQADRVETRIHYRMEPFPKERVQVVAQDSDPRTIETRDLLDAVYNGTTTLKRMESAALRNMLLREIQAFHGLVSKYGEAEEADYRNELRARIESALDSGAAFAAFKRWIVRGHEWLIDEFGEFVDRVETG